LLEALEAKKQEVDIWKSQFQFLSKVARTLEQKQALLLVKKQRMNIFPQLIDCQTQVHKQSIVARVGTYKEAPLLVGKGGRVSS
jgi:hypothetical protein